MKLNIGSGYKKVDGFINIDCIQTGVTDIVMDIEKEILPFEDNSVDEILCYEVLEHLENLIFMMNEMWRVLKPTGILKGKVPGTWAGAIADPTHKRIFVPESFDYFTGINSKHPDQPLRPSNANYGIKPWIKILVDKGINFKLSPRK
jgi:ubiquinone/menaquinone biosynthesis C-methylase UbiE